LRLVSWNCNGALRKKFLELQALEADIYIVQECEDPKRCSDRAYSEWAQNSLWIGGSKSRGLGVFARPRLVLTEMQLDAKGLELFLPFKVNDTVTFLAVWTKAAGSPTFKYIGQLWKYLQLHADFLSAGKSILIGDLNSNVCWDKWDRWWNHSDVVKQLADLGLHSLYHHQSTELQGAETVPTFFMHRNTEKPYHIDYSFLSQELLQDAALQIGIPQNWLAYSDHMPLIVDLPNSLGFEHAVGGGS